MDGWRRPGRARRLLDTCEETAGLLIESAVAEAQVSFDQYPGGKRNHEHDRVAHDSFGDRAVVRGRQSSAFSGATRSPAPATTRLVLVRSGDAIGAEAGYRSPTEGARRHPAIRWAPDRNAACHPGVLGGAIAFPGCRRRQWRCVPCAGGRLVRAGAE